MKRATLAMAMAMNETQCFDIHMKQNAHLHATDSKNGIARGCEAHYQVSFPRGMRQQRRHTAAHWHAPA
jgi:hypothetical protein